MAQELTQVVSMEVDAKGVPQDLKVNGQTLYISPDQKLQGEELLGVLYKLAGMVLALQNQPATRGGGCYIINGKLVCP